MLKINEFFYRLKGKDDFVQKEHLHNEIEFIHVVNGCGTLLKNDRTYLFKNQSVFLIDARNIHIVYPETKNCENYVRNKIVIEADSFIKFCSKIGIENIIDFLFSAAPVSAAENEFIDEIFKSVNMLLESGKKENIGFAHKYILELLEWMYGQSKSNNNSECDTTVQKIINAISKRDSVTNLTEISEQLHMNKYYICHLFKDKTGINISKYISDKQYQKSVKLLVGTTHSVEEIALLCGFSSASSFSRFFKSKSGVSPVKFRKEKQQNVELKF